jgi:macrolide-specific efflux system membrane fusion protein
VHDIELEKFELRVKENAVDVAKLDLGLHAVQAPFAGVVALVRGRPGEWVQPGTVVLRLVAIDRLRAEGFAPAEWVGRSMLGAPVQFRLPTEGSTKPTSLRGVLRFVSPEVDPVSGQVRVWAELENVDLRLRPGQQGTLVVAQPPAVAADTK